jgi:hypothetical protein
VDQLPAILTEGTHMQPGPGLVRIPFVVGTGSLSPQLSLYHWDDNTFGSATYDVFFTITTS